MILSTILLTRCQGLNSRTTQVLPEHLIAKQQDLKKKTVFIAIILIIGVKLPLPSMGAEFCNQCCQSPSGLTFSFITESYHGVLPSWDAICQAVSFDLFPASTFVPSFMSSFVLQATSQIFILPAVFKIRFENWCTQ